MGFFTTALYCFAENFQFSCAQLSVESREKSFYFVAPAPSQVFPCEQEPHEVLLSDIQWLGNSPSPRALILYGIPGVITACLYGFELRGKYLCSLHSEHLISVAAPFTLMGCCEGGLGKAKSALMFIWSPFTLPE